MSAACAIDGYNENRAYREPDTGRWRSSVYEPVVCDCPTSTPERIALFDAWQCSVCYRKCDAPVAVAS